MWKKMKLVLIILIIGGLTTAFVFWYTSEKPIKVKTAKVTRGALVVTVPSTETGFVISEKSIVVKSEILGQIAKIYVDEGSVVTEGDLLAELDGKDYEVQLQLAKVNVALATKRYDQAVAALNGLKKQNVAEIERNKALVQEAQSNNDRMTALFKKGNATQAQKEKAEADLKVAQASLDLAKYQSFTIQSKVYEVNSMKILIEQAEAQMKVAELGLGKTRIRAPFSGIISDRSVFLGDMIQPNVPLFSLVNVDDLKIEAPFDEAEFYQIKKGLKVIVKLDAFPNKTYGGTVDYISPTISGGRLETRTFTVKIRLDEKIQDIKPGMSADVEVVVDDVKSVMQVPAMCIVEREGKKFVFTVDEVSKKEVRARKMEVKVGLSNWNDSEIVSGLSEGQTIIVTPEEGLLKDGSLLNIE